MCPCPSLRGAYSGHTSSVMTINDRVAAKVPECRGRHYSENCLLIEGGNVLEGAHETATSLPHRGRIGIDALAVSDQIADLISHWGIG